MAQAKTKAVNPLLTKQRLKHFDDRAWAKAHGQEEEQTASVSWNGHEAAVAAIREEEAKRQRIMNAFMLEEEERMEQLLRLPAGRLKDALVPFLGPHDVMQLLQLRLRREGNASALDALRTLGVTPGETVTKNRRGLPVRKKYPIFDRGAGTLSGPSTAAAHEAVSAAAHVHHGNLQKLGAALFHRDYGGPEPSTCAHDLRVHVDLSGAPLAWRTCAGGAVVGVLGAGAGGGANQRQKGEGGEEEEEEGGVLDGLVLLRSVLSAQGLQHLQSLKLARCGIDEAGAKVLAAVVGRCGAMCHPVRGDAISWEGLRAEGMPLERVTIRGRLHKLDIRGNAFADGQGGQALCAALACNPTLIWLNGMHVEGAGELGTRHIAAALDPDPAAEAAEAAAAAALRGARGVQVVCSPCTYELAFMAQRMRFNAVVALDLSRCSLTGRYPYGKMAGLRALTQALAGSESLTHLDVSYCHLFGGGAGLLVDMLLANQTVTALNLAQNDIGPKGAAHVLRLLAHDRRRGGLLHSLDVTLNNIQAPIKKKIVEAGRGLARIVVNQH
eukprot:g3516.t1